MTDMAGRAEHFAQRRVQTLSEALRMAARSQPPSDGGDEPS